MKKVFLLIILSLVSTISMANELNNLVHKLLESTRTFNQMELATRDALEASLRIRSGISGFLASQDLFGREKSLEEDLVIGMAEELTVKHFAALLNIGKSGITSNNKPVDGLLKKVCLAFEKEKQTTLYKEESIKCKKI